RPLIFDDLIGQDAMVRTVRNAFETGRIAQAYMLTGVRGVGKTTTARILARALNYQTQDIDQPTVDMSDLGEHCAAIIESRHVDILEMDAASHTGVDNIREIIESARYKPASARYKVYIIDEVHMLSKGAFNALLKTLEEPPDHVKFIFATTEVQKVPVTVLSRCQRFDLRRVDTETLVQHFRKIATLENVEVENEALQLIARAAEGSVRDGLSILDQTIALGAGKVKSVDIRSMLGLADRIRIFDLLEVIFSGDTAATLEQFDQLYADGAEPWQILTNLAEAVHVITRSKVTKSGARDQALSEAERKISSDISQRLVMSSLGRAWQMLLKGISEVEMAPNPIAAAEMVLIRMAHLTQLPSPEEVVRNLGSEKSGISGATGKKSNGNLVVQTDQRPEFSSTE
ncbi:MAG: DNA polymerase III subunit gamma/tau, partial [Desulfobulbia bacterium]